MSKIGRLGGLTAVVLCVGGVVGLLFLFSPQANAEEEPIDTVNEAIDSEADKDLPPRPEDIPPPRDFFTLYPAGEGADALTYDELDKSEKRYLDRAGEWAETGNGYAVQNAWSRVSRQKRNEAKAKRAQQLSGTQALSELGVE